MELQHCRRRKVAYQSAKKKSDEMFKVNAKRFTKGKGGGFSSSRVIPSPSAKVFLAEIFSAVAFANALLGVKFHPVFCCD